MTTETDRNGREIRPIDYAKLSKLWHGMNLGDMDTYNTLNPLSYLVEDLIPERSIGALVGVSGLGKSALLMQLGLCVASGKEFLGASTISGRVLYMDMENTVPDVKRITDQLCKHLGLGVCPGEFHVWSYANPPKGWANDKVFDMIKGYQPDLVIFDTITSLFPNIEKTNPDANQQIQRFRNTAARDKCSIMFSHHLRKPNDMLAQKFIEDETHPVDWLDRTRGASALINSIDFRYGLDRPNASGGINQDIVLVMRGFIRTLGVTPTLCLQRVLDIDGEPLGYARVSSLGILSVEQQAAFNALPPRFSFKEAKAALGGKSAQPTANFLKKCDGLGLIRHHVPKTLYEKVGD